MLSHLMKKLKQEIKTFSLRSWWHIGLEGSSSVVKRKETRVKNKGKCNSPIFTHFRTLSCLCAKYRTIAFLLFDSFFLPFTPLLPSNPICHQLSQLTKFIDRKADRSGLPAFASVETP